MYDIFAKEEEVLKSAERLIASHVFDSAADEGYYSKLVNEYHSMLNQMRRMVKISDLMESKLSQLSHEFDELSKTDFITRLYNRRFFDEYIQKEWKSSLRSKSSLALLLIDIDNFKKFNDSYGHLEGDRCLQVVSEILVDSINRPRDLVARFGGEEFVILLPETDAAGAKNVAEAVLSRVEAFDIPIESLSKTCKVTVSIGLSTVLPEEGIYSKALIKAADKALYIAKQEGRNCIREVIL